MCSNVSFKDGLNKLLYTENMQTQLIAIHWQTCHTTHKTTWQCLGY